MHVTGSHTTSSRILSGVLAGFLGLVAAGCRDEGIRAYEIPKEKPRMARTPTGDGNSPAVHLHWDSLPDQWVEQPPSAMRAASFKIVGSDRQEADVAAIPIPNLSGKELALVNMWREGMGLTPILEEQIPDLRAPVSVSGIEGQLFDMATTEPPEGQTVNQRTVVAMAARGDTTWFFKLSGPEGLVAEQKEPFTRFLKDLEFHDGGHGDAPAPVASLPAAPAGGGASLPKWEVPDGWQPTAPGMMVLASFNLPGGDARVTVSSLGGDGGGLLMNINRWRSQQMGLTPATAADLASMVTPARSTAGEASIVDFSNDTQRLVAVIVPQGGSTWFYKAMGDPATVDREKDAFVKFALSAQY